MVKMKKSGLGLVIPKTLRIGGVTFYQRGGQVIGRVSESREKRSNTLAQFIQRQKLRHTTALWKMLRYAEPMFTERANAYQDFASLANGLPPVYVEKIQMTDASFLMPLGVGNRQWGEQLWLYTAEQRGEDVIPRVRFTRHMVSRQEMTAVDGRLALVSDEFADSTKGWALVRVIGDRCSPQTIQTRCTLYQQYMTDEALQRAAKSYGGITDKPFLSPR